MEIRRFREEDSLEKISRIYALCWKTDYRGILPGDFLDSLPENRWGPLVRADSGRLLLALEEGRWREPPPMARPVTLLCAALKELRRLEFCRVYLWVQEENCSARAFYESQGFSWNGEAREEEMGGRGVRELRYTVPLAQRR
jgi:hypothetical protein